MADSKIITIQVNTTEAVKGIAEYKSKIEEVAAEEKKLKDTIAQRTKEQGSAGKATSEEKQRLAALAEEQKGYKNIISGLSKEVQNNIRVETEKQGSLQKLKADLSLATAEYNKMSEDERNSAQGKDLQAHIQEVTDKLKGEEEELGNFHRNVGNYESGVKSLKQQLRELIQSMQQMKLAGEGDSEAYQKASAKAAELKRTMTAVNNEMKNTSSTALGINAMVQGVSLLTSAWSAYNAVLAASETDDKETAAAMKNVQVALTALITLQQIHKATLQSSSVMQGIMALQHKATAASIKLETAAQSENIIVSKAATAAQWALNAAAAANPYVLLAIAIGTVIGALVLIAHQSKESRDAIASMDRIVNDTKRDLDNMASDLDFDVQIKEAAGASKKALLEMQKDTAKVMLDTAVQNRSAFMEYYSGLSRKQQKEEQEHLQQMNEMVNSALTRADQTRNAYYVNEVAENKAKNDKKLENEKTSSANYVQAVKESKARELEETRKAEDMLNSLIADAGEKARAEENTRYAREIDDLQKKYDSEKNIITKNAIYSQIESAKIIHNNNMQVLDSKAISEEIKSNEKTLELKLSIAKKGSDDEFELRKQQLDNKMQMELQQEGLSAEQQKLIQQQYYEEELQLEQDHQKDLQDKKVEAIQQGFQQQIAAAGENQMLKLQLLAEQAEEERAQMEQLQGESNADYAARQAAADEKVTEAKKKYNDAQVANEQAKWQAVGGLMQAGVQLMTALDSKNKALAIAGKALALGQIAVQTGIALAKGIANAQAAGYPASIPITISTIAMILANIATAIKTVKGAKFATGGLVTGGGTGTSDSVQARLSNGESVNTARATSMFSPIYSVLNQLGGGVPIQAAQTGAQAQGQDIIAAAVARGVSALNLRVGVDEITRVQNRVKTLENVGVV
jgi:hypothetical protein